MYAAFVFSNCPQIGQPKSSYVRMATLPDGVGRCVGVAPADEGAGRSPR